MSPVSDQDGSQHGGTAAASGQLQEGGGGRSEQDRAVFLLAGPHAAERLPLQLVWRDTETHSSRHFEAQKRPCQEQQQQLQLAQLHPQFILVSAHPIMPLATVTMSMANSQKRAGSHFSKVVTGLQHSGKRETDTPSRRSTAETAAGLQSDEEEEEEISEDEEEL